MMLLLTGIHLVVAAVLVYSGLIHASQPYLFVHTVASYRLVPEWAVGFSGLLIPYIQILLGLALGLGIAERAANLMAAVMFAAFSLAQISVLFRGIQIDCGCFGFAPSPVSVQTVLVSIALLIACVAETRIRLSVQVN